MGRDSESRKTLIEKRGSDTTDSYHASRNVRLKAALNVMVGSGIIDICTSSESCP